MEKVLFIGGDQRTLIAMEKLRKKGYTVSSYGLTNSDFEYVYDFDVLVLGVPTTKDKKTVFCPISKREIPLSEIEKNSKGKFIISGGYTFKNRDNTDVLSLDSYCYLNAVPTAEGAIAFAIQNTDFTLWKSNVLIIGNGRVGKILVSRLNNFGCNLTVSARKEKDFALLDTQNIKYVETKNIPKIADNFDVIFNTIDYPIFDKTNFPKESMLIDLSSKGCIDFEAAKLENLKTYKLPSVPAKTAYKTAGEIFADTIIQLLISRNSNGKEMP